jgi:hypothetical protein
MSVFRRLLGFVDGFSGHGMKPVSCIFERFLWKEAYADDGSNLQSSFLRC